MNWGEVKAAMAKLLFIAGFDGMNVFRGGNLAPPARRALQADHLGKPLWLHEGDLSLAMLTGDGRVMSVHAANVSQAVC